MSGRQVAQLVKMANQIARNMAPWGDAAAAKTAEHLCKFWTPAMRRELRAYRDGGGADLSPAAARALDSADN